MKRFHEKVLDCCDPVAEDVLVDVCLHRMIEITESTWIINLISSSVSRLMEVARETDESVKKAVKSNTMIRFMPKKTSTVVTIKKSKGAMASKSK